MAEGRALADALLSRGIAVVCGHDGIVRQVVRDDLAVFRGDAVGQPFTQLLASSSTDKGRLFLAEALSGGAAFDWELAVVVQDVIQLLHFAAAAASSDTVMIVGAETRTAVVRYYEELMRINNEQANVLRTAVKSRAREESSERGADVYDKMMRLNNELATVQRELTKKNIQLERANQVKNQFLGMAAHDLRNPLGAIRSYSEFLLDPDMPLPDDRRRHFLERIRASSQFMLALVDDLLDVATIESGQVSIDLRGVDIAGLVRENVELNRMLAQDKKIDVSLEIGPSVPSLCCDPLKIEQILHNLLSNAMKFSQPGTTVSVTLRAGDGGVWLAIADEGPGIPASEVDGIFRPFHRASAKSTAGERSTGLGLAIVKRAVDAHGGQISCESVVGHGTTFSIWLPEHGPKGSAG